MTPAPVQDEILTRLKAHQPTFELVQKLLDEGHEVDADVVDEGDGDWLYLRTEICAQCGLPNVCNGAFVNKENRIRLWAFCKDCTAGEGSETVN